MVTSIKLKHFELGVHVVSALVVDLSSFLVTLTEAVYEPSQVSPLPYNTRKVRYTINSLRPPHTAH